MNEYQRAAKRLGIDLDRPLTDEERRDLEDEVDAANEPADWNDEEQ